MTSRRRCHGCTRTATEGRWCADCYPAHVCGCGGSLTPGPARGVQRPDAGPGHHVEEAPC